jgi:hypothetical protein
MDPTHEQDAKVALIRTELEALHAEQERFLRRSILVAVLAPLTLIALAVVIDRIFTGGEDSVLTPILTLTAFFLSILSFGVFGFAASMALDERKSLAWRLQALDKELDQTCEALALAGSGKSFALFLRSFGAELGGLGEMARERGNIARGLASLRAARQMEWYIPDLSHIEANNRWRAELEVLGAIGKAGLAVIMLGNIRLGDEMRSELALTRVVELTIQAQEWWDIFVPICNRATVIFFYIEEPSPMLVREMQHVHACGLRYVLCGDDAAIAGLGDVTGVGKEFLADALALDGEDKTAAIAQLGSQLRMEKTENLNPKH